MVALQIAREPLVRQVLRQTFQERAKINISPSKKGKKVTVPRQPLAWAQGLEFGDFTHLFRVIAPSLSELGIMNGESQAQVLLGSA